MKSEISWARVEEALHSVQRNAGNGNGRTVVYLPSFPTQEAFNNHFHRARWYLPKLPGVLDRVVVGVEKPFHREQRPSCFCEPRQSTDHIVEIGSPVEYAQELADAALILVWAPLSSALETFLFSCGIKTLNVTTDDPAAIEYGNYCKVHWVLMGTKERRSLLQSGHALFRELTEKVWSCEYSAAAVFGTGPSIDRAFEFDFSKCYTHICNSIVGSKTLLAHIRPNVVSAGDVVSHFGISLYAERFRRDLIAYLTASDAYFLTTANFGILLTLQCPEISPKVILCDQIGPVPNFNLLEEWGLPGLDSVLNIHMLPAATTLFNNVYILGCDGKNPDISKNEDFWPHSTMAQYHDLVESGHVAHPTFHINRQQKTWLRFKNSVRDTLTLGETQYGKSFRVLAPSFTPGLDVRYSPVSDLRSMPTTSANTVA